MSTAIFLSAMFLCNAINPEFVASYSEETTDFIAKVCIIFAVYDILNMRRGR